MFKGIRELLWDVLKRDGHGSIERMARNLSLKFQESIPASTLYSWMTEKPAHYRRPQAAKHIILVAKILGLATGRVVEIQAEEDARALKG